MKRKVVATVHRCCIVRSTEVLTDRSRFLNTDKTPVLFRLDEWLSVVNKHEVIKDSNKMTFRYVI